MKKRTLINNVSSSTLFCQKYRQYLPLLATILSEGYTMIKSGVRLDKTEARKRRRWELASFGVSMGLLPEMDFEPIMGQYLVLRLAVAKDKLNLGLGWLADSLLGAEFTADGIKETVVKKADLSYMPTSEVSGTTAVLQN